MNDLDALGKLFKNMGADAAQAETMAKQLMKRSLQLAEERNITQVEAMEYLLKVVVYGINGNVFKEFTLGND